MAGGGDPDIYHAALIGAVDRLQKLLSCPDCSGEGALPSPRRSCFRAVIAIRSAPGPCRCCCGSGLAACDVDGLRRGRLATCDVPGGHTALFAAARNGFAQCVAMLLGARACPSSANWEGNTPLMRASVGGHGSCVSLLLEACSGVDALNKHGHTALILAAQAGHGDCVQMLVDAGAAVEARGDEGHTALIRAAQAGHQPCVDVLRNAGACANMAGDDGVNATRWADLRGHVQIAQALAGRVLTVHISAQEAFADDLDLVSVVVTDIQGEELASVAVESAQRLEHVRSVLDGELAGQSYTLILPSGHVLTAEDDKRKIASLYEEGLQEVALTANLI